MRSNSKNLRFLNHICQNEGLSDVFWGRVFPCAWVKVCTYEKINLSQQGEFLSAEFPRFLHWIINRLNPSSFGLALLLWIIAPFKITPIINFFIFLLYSEPNALPYQSRMGRLGPTDHAGASPLAKSSSNCKILCFWHHICQYQGPSGLLSWSSFSMHVNVYEKMHWSQKGEFCSAELPEISPLN